MSNWRNFESQNKLNEKSTNSFQKATLSDQHNEYQILLTHTLALLDPQSASSSTQKTYNEIGGRIFGGESEFDWNSRKIGDEAMPSGSDSHTLVWIQLILRK